jgi:hypothetical protein
MASMPHATDDQPIITRRAWMAWLALWLAPLAVTATAVATEYGLEANSYAGWVAPWIQLNITCELVTLALCMALLVGGGLLRGDVALHRQRTHGGILPESAPEAAIEG